MEQGRLSTCSLTYWWAVSAGSAAIGTRLPETLLSCMRCEDAPALIWGSFARISTTDPDFSKTSAKALKNLVNMHGYHKVAEYMSSHGEVAILRRFTRLNILNLLYLQADIMRLEHRLFEVVDQNTNIITAKDWYELCNSAENKDQVQLGLTLELQEKLDHFNRKLLQQADLMKLGKPNQYDLNFLRTWLADRAKGDWPILGRDRDAWYTCEDDLVVLREDAARGRFSHTLNYKIIPFFYGRFGSDQSGEKEINDRKLAMVVEIIGSLIASLMPLTAILALYFIKNELTRLFTTIGFTAGFCLAILFMTEGTRQIEVFAATSAYAAVLVVYISQGPS